MIAKLLCVAAAIANAQLESAPAQQVVVQGSAAKPAIERILQADNLDVEQLPADEVAARMAEITRGAAPAEFWAAYQAHVRAWQDYAAAKARARSAAAGDPDGQVDGRAIADARGRINRTFDAVKTIAKRYGAWPPRTPTRL
ncbi:hypothetical protein OMW55_10460 [Sphingomonas sp. BN140010]|uniref:Uncharacterized protein n=1 Tax=Sphingomonas arvum TaxID=2992113 RepID=A0ABT3JGN9_9SPHN|nr:hypothetical protein [Sphingomonas sp. BN140010]MCW3798223.1 hypothetical protein [Sphingomonas sp. BN140010]